MSEDIYHEISEDIRQQQLKEFWKENGPWIIGGVIAAIVFTAALSFWRIHLQERDMAQSGVLLQAMQKGDASALEDFAKAADGEHALLARFAAAEIRAGRGEKDKAAALFDDAAKNAPGRFTARGLNGDGKVWRDLARLYSVGQRLDSGDPAELHKDLEKLTDKKSPWHWSALEMQALLYARENKMKEASDTLSEIMSDPLAPQGIRSRALTLHELYASAAGKGNG